MERGDDLDLREGGDLKTSAKGLGRGGGVSKGVGRGEREELGKVASVSIQDPEHSKIKIYSLLFSSFSDLLIHYNLMITFPTFPFSSTITIKQRFL